MWHKRAWFAVRCMWRHFSLWRPFNPWMWCAALVLFAPSARSAASTDCRCQPPEPGPCLWLGMQLGHDVSFAVVRNWVPVVLVEGKKVEVGARDTLYTHKTGGSRLVSAKWNTALKLTQAHALKATAAPLCHSSTVPLWSAQGQSQLHKHNFPMVKAACPDVQKPILVPHHVAHAIVALWDCPFKQPLIFSLDGGAPDQFSDAASVFYGLKRSRRNPVKRIESLNRSCYLTASQTAIGCWCFLRCIFYRQSLMQPPR